jgi:F-type H+-transporting ATPase subunit b
MDSTLQAAQGLLLKALPTIFLVLIVHFYLKYVFFKPMANLLKERHEATEGARKLAAESIAKAEQKAAEYEAAIRAAKSEVYAEQDRMRRVLQDERAAAVHAARQEADQQIAEARSKLSQEAEQLKGQLAAEAENLSERIVATVLNGRAA